MKTGIILKMKDWVNKMADFKTLLTVLSMCAAVILGMYQYTDKFVDNISAQIYKNVTRPTYRYIEFDLMKQLEKIKKLEEAKKRGEIKKYSGDLKVSDIQKFAYYCSGYFGTTYKNESENKIKIEKACNVINKMYADSAI